MYSNVFDTANSRSAFPAMSVKPGRPVDQQKDRDILEAARQLAFEGGPKALTMDRVASRAGVSKATLYARYANRYESFSMRSLASDSSSPARGTSA